MKGDPARRAAENRASRKRGSKERGVDSDPAGSGSAPVDPDRLSRIQPVALETGRPAWETFRRALDAIGFRPSRRLGQNFLLDENMLRAIVRDARVPPGARVVEIGTGCGFLTLHLVRAGFDLTAIEIDPRLFEIARHLLAQERSITWVRADALSGKNALHPDLIAAIPDSGPWHLVSNLPYSIAAPLLVLLAQHSAPPDSMTVLVQREVALRMIARPGSSDWGPLSIRLQLEYAPELLRSVPAALFWPRPDVESALVRLERRPETVPLREREELDRLVSLLFQHRRQTLGRVLSELARDRVQAERWLAELGLDSKRRGEDLDLETLRALGRIASAGRGGGNP
jgi:16S rRNA (adenine1518-N6/adenine1519-N6)-dimethyltransferase